MQNCSDLIRTFMYKNRRVTIDKLVAGFVILSSLAHVRKR